ncbi:alpha-keto acid decarboxylase family protein [Streptomyces sp. AK02-01A]|uniref:alpha-keto acid decarboxylase family protein n=1 Tax=Streptomyces sp. AK02-01A TaxID=3028648 RepID=UPI0029AA9AC3|nr:thiamine pyrophosphate-binding protein [Streptomyces sp. AK02-01A]MDX3853723.1 thiamine pyrophosphate-binding protein [Streptomyces sp. AK02-01A]
MTIDQAHPSPASGVPRPAVLSPGVSGPGSDTTTVVDYLLDRLAELGVGHLFGVPGDYNLAMLDSVVDHPRIDWVGTANELGAAYAADGYARVRGFGALLTTYGVGELSAINGVAGSFAERVALVHIAVGPSRRAERARAAVHHTAGDGDFDRFARAHEQVSCAHTVLSPDNAPAEIDRVLHTAVRERRPGYLRLPGDVATTAVRAASAPLVIEPPPVDAANLAAFTSAARGLLADAGTVAVLADSLVDRYGARGHLAGLVATGPLPHATLSTGKSILDETGPGFLGLYSGVLGDPRTRKAIDGADLLIRAGVQLADTTSGGFSHGFDEKAGIDLRPADAVIEGRVFENVPITAALTALTELSRARSAPPMAVDEQDFDQRDFSGPPVDRDGPLTQDYLWNKVAGALTGGETVLAEQGTSFFGMCTQRLPHGTRFIGQPMWGSIGYTLPALLGSQLADTDRRGVLLIGDGSAQMTIQELGTIARHGLHPVIVLVNNDGYTVERAIHGARQEYNDIATWHWSAVPGALGADDAVVLAARTPAELDMALATAADRTDRLVFIEARTGIDDVPALLGKIAERVLDHGEG